MLYPYLYPHFAYFILFALTSMLPRLSLVFICLIPLGLLSLMAFYRAHFNDPVLFSTIQGAWARGALSSAFGILESARFLFSNNYATMALYPWQRSYDLLAMVAVLLLAVPIWRHLSEGYALYAVLALLLGAQRDTQSAIRYTAVLFPVFLVLAAWGCHSWVDKLITIGFAILLGLFMAMYANWLFVA